MSTLTIGPAAPASRFRWTREEYHRLADLGIFSDRRVELIDGEILEMPPAKEQHVVGVEKVGMALREVFRAPLWVRVQAPLAMPDGSEPVPDAAVVEGPMGRYTERDHPQTAFLVVEVSDSTLPIDRGMKAGLYAGAGIDDYWVLNLHQRRLEVHRKPVPDPTHPHGHRYGELRTLSPEESIAPVAVPDKLVSVASLLP